MKRIVWLIAALLLLTTCGLGESEALSAVCVTSGGYPEIGGCPDVPLYEAPTDGSRLLGRVFSGAEMTVTDEGSGWTQVTVGKATGWMPSVCVAAGEHRAEAVKGGDTASIVVAGAEEGCVLYDRPDTSGEEISRIHAESSVTPTVMLAGGAWIQAVSPAGNVGWIQAEHVGQTSNATWAIILNDAPEHRLHLRAAPSTKAESLGKYYSGLKVRLLYAEEEDETWQRVSAAGVAGWVKKEFLVWSDTFSCGYLPPIGHVVGAEGGSLTLRSKPESKGSARGQYPNGTAVEVLGVVGNWAHVRLRDGQAGYVPLTYLNGEPKAAAVDSFALAEEITANDGGVLPVGTTVQIIERPRMQWYQPLDTAEGPAELTWCEPPLAVYTTEGSRPAVNVSAEQIALDW